MSRHALVEAAAAEASTALAQLLDVAETKELPWVRELPLAALAEEFFAPESGTQAVFADLDGSVGGCAGLIVRASVLEPVLARMLAEPFKGTGDPAARSDSPAPRPGRPAGSG